MHRPSTKKTGENNETKMKKLKEDQGYRAYIITQPKNDNCLNNVVRFMIFIFFINLAFSFLFHI